MKKRCFCIRRSKGYIVGRTGRELGMVKAKVEKRSERAVVLKARQGMERLADQVLRANSPEYQVEMRRREEESARVAFIKRAQKKGFTKQQSEFLYEELALASHEHWDGRIGGG